MENREFENLDPPRRSATIIPYIIIALLTLVIIILVIVFFLSPDIITGLRSTSGLSTEQQTSQMNGSKGASGEQDASTSGSIDLSDPKMSDLPAGSIEPDSENDQEASARGQTITPGVGVGQVPCQGLANDVEKFFNTLDTRDYIQDFQLEAPSTVYFPQLIQKLIDNPPIVSGETDDLFTILQNTAHFFRIIGKNNIFILKGILDRERATFEKVLAEFYQLTGQPECLQKSFNLNIDQESLYGYAGFFLNTMGGRLYLFRRDSMSRMVVNFYAILMIDQANREGRNKYGIEIKDAIDNLIIEIESSRIKLQMRDVYLDTLYDLKVAYQ